MTRGRTMSAGKVAALAGGGIVLAAGALWLAPRWLVPLLAALSPGCLYFVPTAERAVALTIDDGPDERTTPRILELLAAHGARATFFLISSRVDGREAVVRAIAAGGHEIGNHLTRDEPSVGLPPRVFEAALLEADSVLSRYGPLRWARPGSGWYTPRMLEVVRRHGYRCALGSVYPYDPHIPSVRFAAAYIRAHARPGAVIVLHDGGSRGDRTARVLARVLPDLARGGYRVVTLSELAAPRTTPQSGDRPADRR